MTAKPQIELRRVSHSKSLSEETPAYSAQVWIDGAHFCDVSNHGQGGPDMPHPPKGMTNSDLYPRLKALNERIAETYPRLEYNGTDVGPSDLECICHELLDQAEADKWVKRTLNAQVVWLNAKGEVRAIPLKKRPRDLIVAHVMKKEPDVRFLADMPFAEARKLLLR